MIGHFFFDSKRIYSDIEYKNPSEIRGILCHYSDKKMVSMTNKRAVSLKSGREHDFGFKKTKSLHHIYFKKMMDYSHRKEIEVVSTLISSFIIDLRIHTRKVERMFSKIWQSKVITCHLMFLILKQFKSSFFM